MTTMGYFVDASTGEAVQRKLNSDELALLKTNEEYAAEKAIADEAKAIAKKAALTKLGLTEQELDALLG